jgi:hypothetical protein
MILLEGLRLQTRGNDSASTVCFVGAGGYLQPFRYLDDIASNGTMVDE